MTSPIEDYAIIGDCHTAALVDRGGSVDWLCLPRFDSTTAFAALLGDETNGHWSLAPVGEATTTRALRRRLPGAPHPPRDRLRRGGGA